MTCDHTDPTKKAKSPDPLGSPIDYMESCDVFKPMKASKFDLCHFYQVGESGDIPKFPKPGEPATSNHMCSLLEKACKNGHLNLVVALSQETVTAVVLLKKLHASVSLQCLKMETPAKVAGKPI